MNKITKRRKCSLLDVISKYSNYNQACVEFFMQIRYPYGYYCEKCGSVEYWEVKQGRIQECKHCRHHQRLLANTVFHASKLPLFTLILAIYLFFSSNKGISAIDLASQLHVNYKTALLLLRKMRVAMMLDNSAHVLDSQFYEADVIYVGANHGRTNAQCQTTKQPILLVLSTDAEGKYPRNINLSCISKDTGEIIGSIMQKVILVDKNRVLNTDGKTTFNILKNRIKVINEKVDYSLPDHRMKWINIVTGSIKNNLQGVYRGIPKKYLPLFLNEQQWRFNYRRVGKYFWKATLSALSKSMKLTNNMIKNLMVTYVSEFA